MKKLNCIIKTSGGPPPQENIPKLSNNEDMLLFAAWIHGMSVGSTAHRIGLFSFVQTHIENKKEETLQGVIEKSIFWKHVGRAIYTLNNLGYQRISKMFDKLPSKSNIYAVYEFKKEYHNHTISILANPNVGKLIPYVNGDKKTGVQTCNILSNLGIELKIQNSSRTRKILNWIIGDNEFHWRRIDSNIPPEKDLVINDTIFEEDDEQSFSEGKEKFKIHRSKERNQEVVRIAKKLYYEKDRYLSCQIPVCRFSFLKFYGQIGEGYIEAHHIKPLSELTAETNTKIEDIVLVCTNCHKMLHRKRPWLSIDELKKLIQEDNL